MKRLLKIIFYIIFILAVFLAHLSLINCLPHPFHNINLPFLAILWFVILTAESRSLYLALPLAFVLELYASAPFGANSGALIFSLGIITWFLLNIFTNRSFYIVILSSFLGTLLYRLLHVAFTLFADFFVALNQTLFFSWGDFMVETLWEMLFTSVLATIFYIITYLSFRGLNPKYIKIDKNQL